MRCPRCGLVNVDGAAFCKECGDFLAPADAPGPPEQEAAHIAYLLNRVAEWTGDGRLPLGLMRPFLTYFSDRRRALLAPPAPVLAPVAATPPAPAPTPAGPPAPRTAWVAEFLEAHWLKLLSVVAIVLVAVGMRQVLGWVWVSRLALTLVPLLPLGLTVGLYQVGRRAARQDAYGPFAYCSAAIVLTAFCVYSVNRHWLGSVLSRENSLAAGAAASALLAGWTLYRTRRVAYLHLVLAGIAAFVYLTLQAIRPTLYLFPRPLWLYGTGLIGVAAAYMALAWRWRKTRPESEAGGIFAVWAHVCVSLVVLRIFVGPLAGRGPTGEAAYLLFAATALYVLAAQWSEQRAMPYAVAGLATATCLAFFWERALFDPIGFSGAALALSICMLGLSAANRGSRQDEGATLLGAAYARFSEVAAAAAGLLLLGHLVSDAAGSPVGPRHEWTAAALLAGLAGAQYAALAVLRRQPSGMYAAALAGGYALALASSNLLPHVGPFEPRYTAHALLAITSLALALWLALRRAHAAYASPWLHAATVGAGAMSVGCLGVVERGPDAAYWLAATMTLLPLAAGAWLLRSDASVRLAQGWALAALLVAGLCSAAGLWQAAGEVAVPLGVAAPSVVWLACIAVLARRDASHRWLGPLRAALVAGAVSAAAVGLAPIHGSAWMIAGLVTAFVALVGLAMVESVVWPLGVSVIVLLIAPLRFTADSAARAGVGSIAGCIVAAAAYALAAWRTRRPGALWLVLAALAYGTVLANMPGGAAVDGVRVLAGVSLLLGAAAVAAVAPWTQRQALTCVAGVLFAAAFAHVAHLALSFHVAWTGMAALPAVLGLVAAGRYLPARNADPYRAPLWVAAQVAACGAAAVSLVMVSPEVPCSALAAALACLVYAALFATAANWSIGSRDLCVGVSLGLLGLGWLSGLSGPGGALGTGATWSVVVGTVACALLYGRLAWVTGRPVHAVFLALGLFAAWGLVVIRLLAIEPARLGLAGFWLVAALYAAGEWLRPRSDAALGAPLRMAALCLAAFMELIALTVGLQQPGAAEPIVPPTLALYGASLAIAAWRAADRGIGLFAQISLTAAAGYQLGTLGWSQLQWSCAMACIAAVWLVAARVCEGVEPLRPFADTTYGLAGALGGICATVALLTVSTPGQGTYALLTFAVVGTVCAGLFLFGRGSAWAHAGFASYLVAYGLYVYDHVQMSAGVVDFYLIPLGLYLVLVGHLADRQGGKERAGALWWLGALVTVTPTFSAFYYQHQLGGGALHALLLLCECVPAILWGIANRIKAFVFAGTLFLMAFAAVMSGGGEVQIVPGLFALAVGLALLGTAYYLSVHEERVRAWMARANAQWRQWR